MKIFSQGKELSLVSENESERNMLAIVFAEISAKVQTPIEVTGAVERKPHKKHVFMKKCDLCGRSFQGIAGLRRHQTVAHTPKVATPEGMTHLPVSAG